ncbi:MAG: peptidase [Armatimonadetes bacterium]|nr:peptidase [Armatimonadota bacterium]
MQGYYRWPTIHGDEVVFGSEDDLWAVPASGGVARRLTANLAIVSQPFHSPDGSMLAFSGREEGHLEVYTMSAQGGPLRRLTYLGAGSAAIGWSRDGSRVLCSSDAYQPFSGVGAVMSVALDGGLPQEEPYGHAVSISFGASGGVALGRHSSDPARWKRYRGGTAGDIWVDPTGSGEFAPLTDLRGNMARPMWIGDRIYFLSDHEGVGNIYSCNPDGSDISRHTDLVEYFARFPSSDGRRIVFHAGADLYLLDPSDESVRRIEVEYRSPRVQRQRKFVNAAKHLEGYALHPKGHSLAITVRGKCALMGNWEGAAVVVGPSAFSLQPSAFRTAEVRYRCTQWLNDGRRVVTVADTGGEEGIEVHDPQAGSPTRLGDLELGRVYGIRVSPVADEIVFWNSRRELVLVDLAAGTSEVIARSGNGELGGACWAPDGQWVAYHAAISPTRTAIYLWSKATRATTQVTDPILSDRMPCFDPEGRYLYFIGARELNPVYDNLHFDLGFPKGTRPYLVTLGADTTSPFLPAPKPLHDEPKGDQAKKGEDDGNISEPGATSDGSGDRTPKPVAIDLDGIQERVLAFPVSEGLYGALAPLKGKVLFLSAPVQGALGRDWFDNDAEPKGVVECFSFDALKAEGVLTGVSDMTLGPDGKTLAYRSKDRLRVVKAGEKPDEKATAGPPGRASGWIDLSRASVPVDAGCEWRQMAREAWRLQREYFWTPSMSEVDWQAVWDRYAPLIERVGTRGEFSDLMWEMQGELGTSHAYEFGGDYRPEPSYHQGCLGAEFAWDADARAYRFERIVRGAPGEPDAQSPLRTPGVGVHEDDLLTAINGRALGLDLTPQQALVNLAGAEVALGVRRGSDERTVSVRTLRREVPARYREWVEVNRQAVHERTGGRCGYVHIPDMGAAGYAEFHRLYLAECDYDALVVDVRFNRGGHVSQLLLEKLARKRVGYDVQRWGPPEPYPSHSVAGPMVMLTNQFAGSDGDIVSHCFKLMGLGPLIGTRTWGGVIGIGPHNPLVDGTMTTQPEYSFWFRDVGWGVENYGTDPDIEVQMRPQDQAAHRDPQMDKAIEVVLRMLEENPPLRPSFDARPSLALPTALPERKRQSLA